jgi:hypothetical protein
MAQLYNVSINGETLKSLIMTKFVISTNVNSSDPSVIYGSYYDYNNANPVTITWGDTTSNNCTGPTGSQPGLFHEYQNVAYSITASATNNGGVTSYPVTFTLPVSHIARIWFSGSYGAQTLNIWPVMGGFPGR